MAWSVERGLTRWDHQPQKRSCALFRILCGASYCGQTVARFGRLKKEAQTGPLAPPWAHLQPRAVTGPLSSGLSGTWRQVAVPCPVWPPGGTQEIVTGGSRRNWFSEFLILRFSPAFYRVCQPILWPKLPGTPCICAGVHCRQEVPSSGQGTGSCGGPDLARQLCTPGQVAQSLCAAAFSPVVGGDEGPEGIITKMK